MNPGMFGLPGAMAEALSKLRWRKPFSAAELGKPGIRVMQSNGHAVRPPSGTPAQFSSYAIGGLAGNGSMLVAVGTTNTGAATTNAYSSPDGETWTARTVVSGTYNSVVWTGTKFVARYGTAGTVVSTDGITWTNGGGQSSSSNVPMVVFAGKVYNFTISSTAYQESSDHGATWTNRTFPVSLAGNISVFATTAYLYVQNIGAIYRTSDGLNWTNVGTVNVFGNPIGGILFGCDKFIAVAGLTPSLSLSVSFDAGVTWTKPFVLRAVGSKSFAADFATVNLNPVASYGGPMFSRHQPTGVYVSADYQPLTNRGMALVTVTENYQADASTEHVAYTSHVLHSADGEHWSIEEDSMAAGSSGSSRICSHGNGFVLSASIASAAYVAQSNLLFEELIYDPTL